MDQYRDEVQDIYNMQEISKLSTNNGQLMKHETKIIYILLLVVLSSSEWIFVSFMLVTKYKVIILVALPLAFILSFYIAPGQNNKY